MFTVNTNRVIKMNRGDEVQFPLFLNNGTRLNPIRYEFDVEDGCEIYFYILPVNGSFDDYLLKKTFYSSGGCVSEFPYQASITDNSRVNINDKKDMVIYLCKEDTQFLIPGEYMYVVRAKIATDKINSANLIKSEPYMTFQVTNKYSFYLIDDDINRAW